MMKIDYREDTLAGDMMSTSVSYQQETDTVNRILDKIRFNAEHGLFWLDVFFGIDYVEKNEVNEVSIEDTMIYLGFDFIREDIIQSELIENNIKRTYDLYLLSDWDKENNSETYWYRISWKPIITE